MQAGEAIRGEQEKWLGEFVHTYAGYKVSMIKPVARRTVHRQCQMMVYDNDGQFMIV